MRYLCAALMFAWLMGCDQSRPQTLSNYDVPPGCWIEKVDRHWERRCLNDYAE